MNPSPLSHRARVAVRFTTDIPTSICNPSEGTACLSYCCLIISQRFHGVKGNWQFTTNDLDFPKQWSTSLEVKRRKNKRRPTHLFHGNVSELTMNKTRSEVSRLRSVWSHENWWKTKATVSKRKYQFLAIFFAYPTVCVFEATLWIWRSPIPQQQGGGNSYSWKSPIRTSCQDGDMLQFAWGLRWKTLV